MKSARIRSYSGPHFPAFGLRISPYSVQMRKNSDQNNSECGHFLRSESHIIQSTRQTKYITFPLAEDLWPPKKLLCFYFSKT